VDAGSAGDARPEAPESSAVDWSASADTDPGADWSVTGAPGTGLTWRQSSADDAGTGGTAPGAGPGAAPAPRSGDPAADGAREATEARGATDDSGPGELTDEDGTGGTQDDDAPAETLGNANGARWLAAPAAEEGPLAAEPAVADPAADWDRLAAGSRAAAWQPVRHADVLDEGWPGPPLAARQAAANGAGPGEPGGNGSWPPPAAPAGPAPAQPRAAESPATEPAATERTTEPGDRDPDEPEPGRGTSAAADGHGGQPDEKPAAETVPEPAAPSRSGPFPVLSRWTRAKTVPADLAAPPDPADEWISLLTADPADE
jgi:hypothetical protein